MITSHDIRILAARPERVEKSVLTVYLDIDQSEQANQNRGFEMQLRDLLAELEKRIVYEQELRRFQSARKRIEDFTASYQVDARGLAMATDSADGFFWYASVNAPVRSTAHWNHEVFLRPLAALTDEYETYGVVLLDRARFRLFTAALGEIEEHIREEFGTRQVRHIKTAGMDHLGSASHIQRKADERIRANLRHITRHVDWLVSEKRVSRLVLAGKRDIVQEFAAILPKRLQARVIGSLDLSMLATVDEVRTATQPLVRKFESETEARLVEELITRAAKTNRAVTGLDLTLAAVNSGRTWLLVYSEGLRAPGFECSRCSSLFSTPAPCVYCGGTVFAVENIVDRAIEHAVAKGAKIEVVTGEPAERLRGLGGIGVYLRTRRPERAEAMRS